MSDREPILSLRGICKQFDLFHLEEIDLDLYPGEVHVLIGENGAGKSTLMKLVSGWFGPDTGSIIYKGEPVSYSSIFEAKKHGIVYMNQDVQLFDNFTVAENVFFGVYEKVGKQGFTLNRYKILSECRRLFEKLDVDLDPEMKVAGLGYAERQLLAAIQGYVSDVDLVIFDEPSSAMNDFERGILFSLIRQLRDQGKAIFYISHRIDEIKEVGDRISVLSKGRVRDTQDCSDIDLRSLVHMLTGDVQKERYPRIRVPLGEEVLSVDRLAKQPVLTDVSFSLRRGEILGITGLMGSGRTLLANCLFGLVKPDGGSLSVKGATVDFSNPSDAMRSGISLIPENRIDNGIFMHQDLVHNVTNASLIRFMNSGFLDDYSMQSVTQDYVHEFTIEPGQNFDHIDHYSGGNQQKVLISRWFLNRSLVYIMDEPTRSIDAASKIDIYNAMNDLVSKGASIILISSEIEEIIGMSDRILVLARGVIAGELRGEEASKEEILAYATSGMKGF